MNRHLDISGAERMSVIVAFKTISNTIASSLLKYFPEKQNQANFFKLANDAFDVINSRIQDHPNPLKCSLGLCLVEQRRILNLFYETVETMTVVGSKALYTF
jgi:hypothetical protein